MKSVGDEVSKMRIQEALPISAIGLMLDLARECRGT